MEGTLESTSKRGLVARRSFGPPRLPGRREGGIQRVSRLGNRTPPSAGVQSPKLELRGGRRQKPLCVRPQPRTSAFGRRSASSNILCSKPALERVLSGFPEFWEPLQQINQTQGAGQGDPLTRAGQSEAQVTCKWHLKRSVAGRAWALMPSPGGWGPSKRTAGHPRGVQSAACWRHGHHSCQRQN